MWVLRGFWKVVPIVTQGWVNWRPEVDSQELEFRKGWKFVILPGRRKGRADEISASFFCGYDSLKLTC